MKFANFAFGITAVLFVGSIASTADAPKKNEPKAHHAAFEKCAAACSDCQRACDSCGAHCATLITDGKKEHLKTHQACQDCATHCAAASCIVARKGPYSDLICKACAEACARCGKECDRFPNDAIMKKCAEECRSCEKECQGMVARVASAGTDR
jgi:hypothetical protein